MTVPIDFKNCTSSCREGGHRSYGECLRAKGLSTASGDTTKASPPTKANDALTAKAAPKRRPNPPHEHEEWQLLPSAKGGRYCGACGVHVDDPAQDWFPCATHAPTAHPACAYCTTTTNDMVRATTNPADLRSSRG